MDRYQNMDLVVDDLKAILKELLKSGDNRDLSDRRSGKKETESGLAKGSEDKYNAQTARIRRPVGRTSQLADEEKGEQVGHGPAINFKSFVAAAAILIVAVGGCIWWQFEANRKKGEATAIRLSNASPASAGLTPAARVIDKTPFVAVTGAGDKKQIDCQFPDDTNLGEILLDSPDKTADTKVIICTGRQKIEGKHRLYFFPSVSCINNPDYFCKFGPDLLYSITLPARDLEYKDSVSRAMSRITQIKGLLRLDLFNCEAVSDDVVPLLDQSEQLEDLALDANCIGTKKLILGKTINRIKYLKYTYSSGSLARRFSELHHDEEDDEDRSSGREQQRRQYRRHGFGHRRFAPHEIPNITQLLECLTRSTDLQVLEIPKFSLLPHDLQLISQLKNLRVVDLSESNIVSPNVALLSNLKHLQVFHVDRCMINGAALPAFKKLAAHSLKIISMNSTAMPASEVQLFRKELPGVSVNDY